MSNAVISVWVTAAALGAALVVLRRDAAPDPREDPGRDVRQD